MLETNDALDDGQQVLESLRRLFRARQLAEDCGKSVWDFAIEIQDLQKTGVSSEQLRWLVAKQIVDHATEDPAAANQGRRFRSFGGLRLTDESCFTLTEEGLKLLVQSDQSETPDACRQPDGFIPINGQPRDTNTGGLIPEFAIRTTEFPVWDGMRRELRLGSVIVKKFRCRAANQESVLAAFQEDGWPARIDDPLSPVENIEPKRRLADTVKCLNRKQAKPLLKFAGDGTGEGVTWRKLE